MNLFPEYDKELRVGDVCRINNRASEVFNRQYRDVIGELVTIASSEPVHHKYPCDFVRRDALVLPPGYVFFGIRADLLTLVRRDEDAETSRS